MSLFHLTVRKLHKRTAVLVQNVLFPLDVLMLMLRTTVSLCSRLLAGTFWEAPQAAAIMSLTAAGTVVATVSRNRAHAAERVRALYRAWYREVLLVPFASHARSTRLT